MFEKEIERDRVKPRLVLTRKFPDSLDMELEEEGQIDVVLQADGGEVIFDGMNDIKNINFKVISLKRIVNKQARV